MTSMAPSAAPLPGRRVPYRWYLVVLCTAVAVLLVFRVPVLIAYLPSAPLAIHVIGAVAILADTPLFTIADRTEPTGVSGSIMLTFTMVLAYGHGSALVAQVVAVLAGGLLARRTAAQVALDVGRYGIAIFLASRVVNFAGRRYPFAPPSERALLVVLLAVLVWFAAFHLLTVTGAWLRTSGSWWPVFLRLAGPQAIIAVPLLLISPLLLAVLNVNVWLTPLVLAPMFAVSRMSRLASQRAHQYLTDPLTGLASRAGLDARATGWIGTHPVAAGAGEPAPGATLLVLDLDRFRYVNEALSHEVGDLVLRAVAHRLAGLAGPEAVAARLAGDQFAVFVPGIAGAGAALRLAEAIRSGLAAPVLVNDLPVEVTVSIGVAVYPVHGRDFATLLRRADGTMYRAKLSGDSVAVYQAEPPPDSSGRLRLIGDLRRALEEPGNTEIAVWFQPQIALDSGAIVGVEALLRWKHPTRGVVPPAEVIRAAEHTGVMRVLTEKVISEAVAALGRWHEGDLRLRASINVSARDLYRAGLVDWLAATLRRHGIDPGQVQLEITESALMADPERVAANLRRLHDLGVGISLDDFGTGYSSLQHLRRLPVSEVKIDQSFVRSMAGDPDDDAIVRSIIGLARELGIRVVAEGVEDERTARMLRGYGCHSGQGWHFAKAMPASEIPGWSARHRPPDLAPHRPSRDEAVDQPTRRPGR